MPEVAGFPAGEAAAHDALSGEKGFLTPGRLKNYDTERNNPTKHLVRPSQRSMRQVATSFVSCESTNHAVVPLACQIWKCITKHGSAVLTRVCQQAVLLRPFSE